MAELAIESKLTGQIDVIVADVFHMMLQLDCGATDVAPPADMEISAKVMLTGTIDAQCVIEFPPATAKKLTNAFMGSEGEWEEGEVNDVLGELCNMVAGGWKSQMDAPASASRLSLPVISRGPDRHTLDSGGTVELRRTYALDDSLFLVNLAIHN